jgi:hypothetical protein
MGSGTRKYRVRQKYKPVSKKDEEETKKKPKKKMLMS